MRTTFDSFALESGVELQDVVVEYRTWGRLNEKRDNAVLVCHALTGNADVDDWWGGLLGPGMALDTERYFVVAANNLGSCYGTTGPSSTDPATGNRYGASFPAVTVRDAVRLQRALLDRIDVRGLEFVIGGSMGGMLVLEWAFQGEFVRRLIPIGVGAAHSAWCVGWSEAQRQAIYADPHWSGGNYDPASPPEQGLAIARMIAMLSYRSRTSFEDRFGRNMMPAENGTAPPFAVESYLRYQGRKLVERFDALTYVRLTELMDSHDLARGRGTIEQALAQITQPTLVIGIDSDVLYPLEEQRALVDALPRGELAELHSPHGHDAFLIEFDQLNDVIVSWVTGRGRSSRGASAAVPSGEPNV